MIVWQGDVDRPIKRRFASTDCCSSKQTAMWWVFKRCKIRNKITAKKRKIKLEKKIKIFNLIKITILQKNKTAAAVYFCNTLKCPKKSRKILFSIPFLKAKTYLSQQ